VRIPVLYDSPALTYRHEVVVIQSGTAAPDQDYPGGNSFRPRGYATLVSRPDVGVDPVETSQGEPGLVDARDLDGDGVCDAVLVATGGYGLTWYRGLGGGRFEEPDRYGESLGAAFRDFTPADLDADGTADLLGRFFEQPPATDWLQAYLARGDGTFAPGPVLLPEQWSNGYQIHDLDGDRWPDVLVLPRDDPPGAIGVETMVHYGRGDGSFESAVDLPHLAGGKRWSYYFWLFGDLDGDGDDDALARIPPWGMEDVMGWPLFVEARESHYGPHGLERRGGNFGPEKLLDVDGDGRADPLYVLHPAPADPARDALIWRRTTEDGDFEAERTLLDWDASSLALAFVARADVDAAEPGAEIVAQLAGPDANLTLTFAGSGREERRLLWSGEIPGPAADSILDADGDGRLDLATTRGGFHVIPGDGRGGFLRGRARRWYGEADSLVQDFDGDGFPDLLGTSSMNGEPRFAISLDAGLVLDEDAAPPSVEILLDPVLDPFDSPAGFWNEWHVSTLADDDCAASPEVLTRRVDWPAVPAGAPRRFRLAAETEIRVYQPVGGGRTTIVLRGPSEMEARALLARIEFDGGAAIDRVDRLLLVAHDMYGLTAGELGDGDLARRNDRLIRRFRFSDGRLTGAFETRPGGDVTLTARARDGAGNESVGHASVAAAYHALCAGGEVLVRCE
jgi:hypothetical protein